MLLGIARPFEGEPANAQPIRAPSQPDQRAPLQLIVDGAAKTDVIVILRGRDILVPQSDLLGANVPLVNAVTLNLDGVVYVSLASLAPHVAYRIASDTFALELTVDPSFLPRSAIAVTASTLYQQPARADPSAFLTYSASTSTANLAGVEGFVQGGAGSAAAGLFTASASFANGVSHRGLFAYQRESEQHLRSLTVGDEYASTGELGGNVVIGGFGATRHFAFQPNYTYFPLPGLSGTALTPTTADLYVNGALVHSVQLAPGAFDLSNIPVPPGAGVTQIVLRDAYGNTRTLSGVYYETRELLRKGLTDYSYHVGLTRQNPFGTHDVYGPFAALGDYRLGLSDAVTAGARFEQTAGTVSGGPQLDVALPLGHLSLETGFSSSSGMRGNALAAAYDYFGRHFGVSLSALMESARYATVSLNPNAPRLRSSVRANLALPLSNFASLNVSDTTTSFTAQPVASELLVSTTLRPPRQKLYITLSAARDRGGSIFGIGGPTNGARWTMAVQTTLLLGTSTSASLGATTASGAGSATLGLAKSAPNGPGFGYQFQTTGGTDRTTSAQIDYQSQYGQIETSSNAGSGAQSTMLTVAGSLVAFRQGVFFTRPVSGAYSLVEIPGLSHLPVFLDGQYAGRTDGRDAMIVPNLDPYYANSLAVHLVDRLDLSVDEPVQDIRPKSLSGVVVRFDVRSFHAYSGQILIRRAGLTIVPAHASLVLSRAGQDHPTDLGTTGQFYVENLAAGAYAARVTTTDERVCAFQLSLPVDAKPVTSVGTLTCDAAP
jgi:outer membrane usher protein